MGLDKIISKRIKGTSIGFNATIRENERAMRKDMRQQAAEMLERSGFKDIYDWEDKYVFGNGIHEMGTARMGHDPKTSVLNKFNQVHSVKNVYVTDGASMTSSGCQNPSITYMALTARAANHAVDELNKQYSNEDHSFEIRQVAGGYQLVARKEYEHLIRRLLSRSGRLSLSPAALDTLSIIAYKQPVSRYEIEAIRGVDSSGVIKTLLNRKMVKIKVAIL